MVAFSRIGGPPVSKRLSWGTSASVTAAAAAVPSGTNYTILTPSGAAPVEATLGSHRYHHHTSIHVFSSRVWVMSSSSLNNEDASGQMAVIFSSADNGSSWSAPAILVAPQSTMDDTTGDASRRICWPRGFYETGGKLYAVVNVQSGSSATALALLATECVSDGSLGTTKLLSPSSYTPIATFPSYSYDAALDAALTPTVNLYGSIGGPYPGTTPQAWTGWLLQDGDYWVEPVTFARDGTGTWLQRLWRKTTGTNTGWWWLQDSHDGGAAWSPAVLTNIPNSPAAGAAIRLADGRVAMVGDLNSGRDPLHLALFNPVSGQLSSIYAVRSGVSGTPTYAGAGKAGGAQYPGIHYDGTNLWVSYSLQKESVGATKIPLSGI